MLIVPGFRGINKPTDLVIYHDETGVSHFDQVFGHCVGLRRCAAAQLQSELSRVRGNFAGRLQWKSLSDGKRSRTQRQYAERLVCWFFEGGFEYLAIYSIVVDRSDALFNNSKYGPSNESPHICYNFWARQAMGYATAYCEPDLHGEPVASEVYSDYKSRRPSDNFVEYLRFYPFKSAKCELFFNKVECVGTKTDCCTQELQLAREVLQVVDFFAGAAAACVQPMFNSSSEFKRDVVQAVSQVQSGLRDIVSTRVPTLKRRFEIVKVPDEQGKVSRYFKLPHLQSPV